MKQHSQAADRARFRTLTLAGALLLLLGGGPGLARGPWPLWLGSLQVPPEDLEGEAAAEPTPSPLDLFLEEITRAWGEADFTALAALVVPDGLLIAGAPEPGLENHYSPDQSHYFFKNLFQFSATDTFAFSRWQEDSRGGTVHAVADWTYRRSGSEEPITERFLFSLVRESAAWRLAEIRAIR